MAEKKVWKVDPSHSQIHFLPLHMGINLIPGRFNEYEGKIEASEKDFSDLKAELTIKTKSLDTGNADRDQHLYSDEFFNVEQYPELSFRSTGVEGEGDKLILRGDITIRDVTKEISLEVDYRGTITDPGGKRRAGFELRGKLNRMDYGIKWDQKYNRGPVVDHEVKLKCNIEAVQED